MKFTRRTWVASFFLLASAGLLLHGYTVFFRPESGIESYWLFLLYMWIAAPYVLTIVVQIATRWVVGPLVAMVGLLVIDVWMHFTVFVSSKEPTAALTFLGLPVWNMILVVPLGLVLGWGIERSIRKSEQGAVP